MAQPPINRAQLVQSRVAAWNQTHPGRTIDPAAELAVARQEGLGGGVGDNGTSFGPNQLHFGGAYPASAPHDPQAAQQWAWSPAGIDYALQQIASVAGGQHGRQAVSSIVSRFERPANPGREIANALAAYGGGMSSPVSAGNGSTMPSGALSEPGMSPPSVPSGGGNRRQLLLALANSVGQKNPNYTPLLTQLLARRDAPPAPSLQAGAPPPQAPAAAGYPGGHGQIIGNTTGEQPSFLASLAALAAYEHAPVQINSGYRSIAKQAQLYASRANNPNPVAPPGHSLHEQGLAADGTVGGKPLGTLPAALLARYGLMPVPGDPVHVQVLR